MISGLFILWATWDIKRFKQASKRKKKKKKTKKSKKTTRNEIKQDADVVYTIKCVYVGKTSREKNNKKEISSLSHSLSGEVTYVIAPCPCVR